jgi:serine/threonine protein kinase
MAVHHDPAMLVGRSLDGKYLIEKLLGTGSMGAVYRARQTALERTVAVKVMSAALARDGDFAERFHREAKAASRLAHPNSVSVTDFGQADDGLLYLVMEYVDGKNLDVVIQEDFPLGERRIANILGQVLSAVASAHDLGIVHRDLKPENILVLPSIDDEGLPTDIVKVCDFGIAKMLGVDDMPASDIHGERAAGRKLTAFGAILGTPAYMSPEQGQGLPPEPRSDLYAIGAMLFEMLTKRIPFELDAPEDLVRAHMFQAPRDPRRLSGDCSDALAEICLKALQKLPEHRFATARIMRSAVRRIEIDGDDGRSAPLSRIPSAPEWRGMSATLPSFDVATLVPTLSPEPSPESHGGGAPMLRSRKARMIAGAIAIAGLAAATLLVSRSSSSTAGRPELGPRVNLPGSSVIARGAALGEPNAVGAPAAVGPSAAGAESLTDAGTLGTSTREGASAAARGAPRAGLGVLGVPSASARAGEKVGVAGGSEGVEAVSSSSVGVAATAAATVTGAAERQPPEPSGTAATPTGATPPTDATATPAVAAAAAPFSPEQASVVVSVTAASGTNRATISALTSHVSFTDCYRGVLRTLGRAEGGKGTMHLEIDEDGVVQGAQARLPGALGSAGPCFASRMLRQRLPRPPDTGAASADLALELSP